MRTLEIFKDYRRSKRRNWGNREKKCTFRSPSVSYFKVFNFTEVEGAPPFEIPERIKDEKIQEVIRNLEKSSKS